MILNAMTKYGEVQGVPTATDGIAVFKGIPYAAPPVGERRWKAPLPPEPWNGVRVCDTFQAVCPQPKHGTPFYSYEFFVDYSKVKFSEDCLYLNIWTPAKTAGDKLPVMMWMHGGGSVGFPQEPEFDGEALAKRGVIYISICWRVGVFGFMAHPELTAESEYGASGNYGNLDQIAALKWIKENIAAFGGDPDNVTIFGQSGGGGYVHTLSTSPLSKGLVNRAISMSASGVASLFEYPTLAKQEQRGLALQEASACRSLAQMRQMPGYMVLYYCDMSHQFYDTCIDGYVINEKCADAILAGRHHDIDYMVGSTAHEGAAFTGPDYKDTYESFKARLPGFFPVPGSTEAAFQFYGVKNDADAAAFDRDLMSDGAVYGTNLWGMTHLKLGRRPVYLYQFDRVIPDRDGNPSWESSFHSGELWYVHGTLGRSWRGMTEDDYKTSNYMMDYWTNFAKNGNPNGEGLPVWTPYTDDDRRTMLIDEAPHMSDLADNPGVQLLKQTK